MTKRRRETSRDACSDRRPYRLGGTARRCRRPTPAQPIDVSSSSGGGARRGRCQRGGVGTSAVGSRRRGGRGCARAEASHAHRCALVRRTMRASVSSREATSPSSPISTVGSCSTSASGRAPAPTIPTANRNDSTSREAQAAHGWGAARRGRGSCWGTWVTAMDVLARAWGRALAHGVQPLPRALSPDVAANDRCGRSHGRAETRAEGAPRVIQRTRYQRRRALSRPARPPAPPTAAAPVPPAHRARAATRRTTGSAAPPGTHPGR